LKIKGTCYGKFDFKVNTTTEGNSMLSSLVCLSVLAPKGFLKQPRAFIDAYVN